MKNNYQKMLKGLAHVQTGHPYLSLILILILTTIFVGGMQYVETVASLENMLPTDTVEIEAFNELRDIGLGQDIIAIIIQTNKDSSDVKGIVDITDYEVYRYIVHLNSILGSEQDVLEVYSIVSIVGTEDDGAPYDEQTYDMITDSEQAKPMLSQFINTDYTNTIMLITTDVGADDKRMKLLTDKVMDDIDSAGHPPGISIDVTGMPRIQQKLGQMIASDRVSTQNISTLLVFLITMIVFGTFTSAIVPIIVVTLTVNWLYGTMGYVGLPISTLAGGVAAMVIGIGIDYALHLMNKFKYERQRGMTIAEAIEEAVSDTGMALTGAAIATILAFMAFILGDMPEMARFGLLMSIGVGYAFMFSLFGLPSLLILEERAIGYLKKRLKFGVEGEFRLVDAGDKCPVDHVTVDHPELDGYKIAVRKKLLGDKK